MKRIVLALMLVLSGLAIAQTPKPVTPKPLSDKVKLAIREAQLRVISAGDAVGNAQKEFNAAQEQINKAVEAAYKEAGVDQKDWQLQNDLSFAAAPKPKATEAKK